MQPRALGRKVSDEFVAPLCRIHHREAHRSRDERAWWKQAGIDPVYFGVLFIINNAIGLLTPPVGVVLNVVCGVSRISMEDIIKGVWPFMIAQLVVLFLMVLFPQLVTAPAKWFGG